MIIVVVRLPTSVITYGVPGPVLAPGVCSFVHSWKPWIDTVLSSVTGRETEALELGNCSNAMQCAAADVQLQPVL